MKNDLTGKTFGYLQAIKKVGVNKFRLFVYECQCKCGKKTNVPSISLKSGNTKSCGCYQKESAKKVNTRHGMSRTRFHNIWKGLAKRCQRHRCYLDIKVCDEWKTFENFRNDMLKSYNGHIDQYGVKNTTIDRIDPNKGYSKDNCRWATWLVQNQIEHKRKQ